MTSDATEFRPHQGACGDRLGRATGLRLNAICPASRSGAVVVQLSLSRGDGRLGILPALLGCSRFGFLDLLDLLGRDPSILGRLCGCGCLVLLSPFGFFRYKSRLLVLGLLGLLGRGSTRIFCPYFLQLHTRKVRVEPLRISLEERLPCVTVARLERQFIVAANGVLGICLRAGRDWLRCDQGRVIAAKRPIDIGLLLISGALEHIVADEAKGFPQVEPRRGQAADESRGKRAVLGITIRGGRTRLRRECNHGVRIGRLDLGQAAPDAARRNRSLHRPGEGIVPACIQDDEAKLLGRLDGKQHPIERERLVQDIRIGLQRSVGWDQVVGAVEFDAVTCVIDDGHFSVSGLAAEVAQRLPHIHYVEVQPDIYVVKPGLPQHVAN